VILLFITVSYNTVASPIVTCHSRHCINSDILSQLKAPNFVPFRIATLESIAKKYGAVADTCSQKFRHLYTI